MRFGVPFVRVALGRFLRRDWLDLADRASLPTTDISPSC